MPREVQALLAASLQFFVQVTTFQHLVDQEALFFSPCKTHEDYEVGMSKLAQHYNLLLKSSFVWHIQDLDGNLGAVPQRPAVDATVSS
jgi:hypothetical protein